jgi:hypothetical protein
LLISLAVVVSGILSERVIQSGWPEEDEMVKAHGFDASFEALCLGDQIGRTRRKEDWLDAVVIEHFSESLGGLVSRSMMRCVAHLSGLSSNPVKANAARCMNNSLG